MELTCLAYNSDVAGSRHTGSIHSRPQPHRRFGIYSQQRRAQKCRISLANRAIRAPKKARKSFIQLKMDRENNPHPRFLALFVRFFRQSKPRFSVHAIALVCRRRCNQAESDHRIIVVSGFLPVRNIRDRADRIVTTQQDRVRGLNSRPGFSFPVAL